MPALSSYPDRVLTRALGHDSGNLTGKAYIREVLTGNRTYYVRADGSDSNTGLVNNAGGAFLTIAKAWSVICANLDLAGFTVTIQLDGTTFSTGLAMDIPWIGGGAITFDGGGGTLSTGISDSIECQAVLPGAVTIQNVTITNTTGSTGINHQGSGIISLGSGVIFGACGLAHMQSQGVGSFIRAYVNYTITGGAVYHILAFGAGAALKGNFSTVTLTGTPAFGSSFAAAGRLGGIEWLGCTFVGGATGQRYSADTNGVLNTNGSGATYFPGDVSGTATNGGVYI